MGGSTVAGRLALGFSLMIFLLVASMAVGINRLQALGTSVDDYAQGRVPKLAAGGKVVETLLQSAREMRNVLILDHEEEIRSEIADVARNAEQVRELLAQIEKYERDEAETNLLKAITQARDRYLPAEEKFLALARKGDYSSAKDEMLAGLRTSQDAYISAVNSFIEYQSANSESEAREAHDLQARAKVILLVLLVAAVAAAVLAAAVITRGITRSLGGEPSDAASVARAIAEGDLTVSVASKGARSESLMGSMARMRESLSDAVGEIRRSAEVVGTASEQIAKGNANLSTRTEEQATALGETAASMEEITSAVKQNAHHAAQARVLAQTATTAALSGGDAMRGVVTAMQGISESSNKIAEIIGSIDAIAFQTNILALNAAVEAARAGEQGRGFAVVAAEVRTLAQRSAQLARQVKALVGESQERVGGGMKQVDHTGATIEQTVEAVKRMGAIVTEIAEASRSQLQGIEQVNVAVTQIDSNTQQNAAVVEQAAAAAEHLSSQAEALVAAVARFTVDAAAIQRASSEPPVPSPPRRTPPKEGWAGTTAVAALAVPGTQEEWREF